MTADSPTARTQFLELAHVILDRLISPRLPEWWLDVCEMTAELEVRRMCLRLPAWLPDFDSWLDFAFEAAAKEVRIALDRSWKPGRELSPACFSISHVGSQLNGTTVRFAFCDPYRSMDFVRYNTNCRGFGVTTRLLPADESGTNNEQKNIFDDIRRDAIFCLEAWIRYVKSDEITFHIQDAFGTDHLKVKREPPLDPREPVPRDPQNAIPPVAGGIESTSAGSVPDVPQVFENLPKAAVGTKRRQVTREDVEEYVNSIFESGDMEEVERLLTATADDLAFRIGCDRKTVFASSWWRNDHKDQRERFFLTGIVPRPRKTNI